MKQPPAVESAKEARLGSTKKSDLPPLTVPASAIPQPSPLSPETAIRRYQVLLSAAAKLPSLERAFSRGWPSEARTVLPSYSPQISAVAVWAPVIAWCLLRTFLDSLPRDENTATLFDRLYLHTALAEAFGPVGLEGENGYRAAARVRLLLTEHAVTSIAPPLPMAWQHPDIVWLPGLHEAEGHRYFHKEASERTLWWRHLPQLVAIAEKDASAKMAGTRAAIRDMERANAAAAAAAQAAGYRLDRLPAQEPSPERVDDPAPQTSEKNPKKLTPLKEQP